ncbi:MAG: tetratricopeptide repeat protein [Deltaproteobacteria bacterium]|nr:tetratricopeptide repeat protein [Deltaproteobacteria bacterium]
MSDEKLSQNVIGITGMRSKKLIDTGLELFSEGDVEEAIKCFKKSLDLEETPEGYTYWAWMLSFTGELDQAIELCKTAIQLDEDFGNPYNDIGTYYMKKGELERAVPWLEKAKNCKRYEPKQFPFLNLGRIYLSQGMFLKALREFEGALEHDPENSELRSVIARIRQNHA